MKRNLISLIILAGLALVAWAWPKSTIRSVEAAPTTAAPRITCILTTGARIQRSSVALGDLNHDGVKDIVVGGSDGYVHAINGSTITTTCSELTGWPKQVNNYFKPPVVATQSTTQDIESTPALVDLNNDGWLEVVVTVGWMPQMHQNGGIIVFDHNGNVMPGWPRVSLDINGKIDPTSGQPWLPDGYTDGVFSTPAIGDVNGDGRPEIIYGAFDKCIYVWEPDGTPAPGWWDYANNKPARCLLDTIWSSPALVDLNGDGIKDIVVGTDADSQNQGGSIKAFTGNNILLWSKKTTQTIQSTPAVGDINGDGYPEIVVGTGTYYPQGYNGYSDGHKVYALDRFGNDLPGWPQPTAQNMYASPSLADLDNDGKLEILIGEGAEPDSDATNDKFYVWRYDGSNFPGYPRTLTRSNPWTINNGQASSGMPYVPIVADYNNDGVLDVFVVHSGSWGVSVFPYNNPGSIDPYKYTSDNTLGSAPVVDNLYNDNREYMIVGGASSESTGNHAAVYIWQLSSTAAGQRPWPMARHDSLRTGVLLRPAALSVPSSLLLMHQNGPGIPSTERVLTTVKNTGEVPFNWSITSTPPGVTVSPMSGRSDQVITVTVNTSFIPDGINSLGRIAIGATADYGTVANAPASIQISLYVGTVYRTYLPLILR